MKDLIIAPSLLSADFGKLVAEVADIEAGGADWLHLDIMDGQYVPNITFGPSVIKALRQDSQLFFDTHLMIVEPDRYIADFVAAGSDMITVHVEATRHLHRTLQSIHSHGVKSGVSLNPATPLCSIRHVLDMVDMVLLMSVNPGFGGQKFIDISEKIVELAELASRYKPELIIQIDGGITPETAPLVTAAGANCLVAGSAVFGKADRAAAMRAIRDRVRAKLV